MDSSQSNPEVEAPPALSDGEKRLSTGWVLLGCLFALMILTAVTETFSDKSRGQSSKESGLTVQATNILRLSGNKWTDPTKQVVQVRETILEDGVVTAQESRILRSIEAALKMPATEKAQARLQSSWLPGDQVVSAITSQSLAKEPNAELLKAITPVLPTSDPTYRLAVVVSRTLSGEPDAQKQILDGPWKRSIGVVIAGILGLAFGIVCLVSFVFYRSQGSFAPAGWPTVATTKLEADHLALRAFILLFAFLGSGMIPLDYMPLRFAVFFAIVIAGLVMPIQGARLDLKQFFGKFRWTDPGKGLLGEFTSLPLIFVAIGVTALLSRFLPEAAHPGSDELASNPSVKVMISFFLLAVIQAPIVEEIIFRGMIAPAISRFSKPWTAIAISGFLFAAIHPQGIAGWPPLFVVGCSAAYLTYHSKSLWPAIFLHAFHNGGLFVLNLMINS